MAFDFDSVIERRGTGSVKFDFAVENGYPADVLPLWVADMDFQAPPCVVEALKERVEHGIFGYTGLKDDYFEAVQGWFSRRFGWELQKEWLVTTPGVVFALSAAVRVMTQPGDAVLIQTPVYYPFYRVILNNDRKVVENPLVYRDGKYFVEALFSEFRIGSIHLLFSWKVCNKCVNLCVCDIYAINCGKNFNFAHFYFSP